MKALLTQLALILGGVVSALSLALNLSQGMDLLSSVFRASLVFFATVIVLFLFLQFFSVILVRFVAEQVLQNRPPVAEEERGESKAGARKDGAPVPPAKPAAPLRPGSAS